MTRTPKPLDLTVGTSLRARGARVRVIEPALSELIALLEGEDVGLYHFECHGTFGDGGDLSRIFLKNGEFLAGYVGSYTERLERNRPFVFQNSCETGGAGYSLAGFGGWAAEYLGAGASAFVAPLWAVNVDAARLFAAAVYAELAAGRTLGEAVLSARGAVRKYDDTYSWLAYAVFGDPNARIEFPGR